MIIRMINIEWAFESEKVYDIVPSSDHLPSQIEFRVIDESAPIDHIKKQALAFAATQTGYQVEQCDFGVVIC